MAANTGLHLRKDHGRQYDSADFTKELNYNHFWVLERLDYRSPLELKQLFTPVLQKCA